MLSIWKTHTVKHRHTHTQTQSLEEEEKWDIGILQRKKFELTYCVYMGPVSHSLLPFLRFISFLLLTAVLCPLSLLFFLIHSLSPPPTVSLYQRICNTP